MDMQWCLQEKNILMSRVHIRFDASATSKAGSQVPILQAWLHDTQYCPGFETGSFGGTKDTDVRIRWGS